MVFTRVGEVLAATLVAAFASLPGAALAQAPEIPSETVSWSAQSLDVAKPGHSDLTLHGTVVPGWHVYSLKQAPEGPTPLLVSVAANNIATVDGAPAGSPPA